MRDRRRRRRRLEGGVLTTARLIDLCIDANDPLRLARFWADALRWEIDHASTDEAHLAATDDTTFGIVFRPVPERKAEKNRIHLDLTSASLDDQRDSVARFVEHGARHIEVGQRPDDPHVVLADPEGNELCVIEPQNSFLAGCGRLGALSCDGSRTVGYFWSNALAWPLVWDQDDETAIRAPDGTGPFITWGGGPLPPKRWKNRLRLEVAPDDDDPETEVDRLVSLGATLLPARDDTGAVEMSDPDGNEFSVLRRR